jgi:hypothetical protein
MSSLLRLAALLAALWAPLPAERLDAPGGEAVGPAWSAPGRVEHAPLEDGDPHARQPEHGCEAAGASRPGSERDAPSPPAEPPSQRSPRCTHGASTAWAVVADRASTAQAFLRVNGAADAHGARA